MLTLSKVKKYVRKNGLVIGLILVCFLLIGFQTCTYNSGLNRGSDLAKWKEAQEITEYKDKYNQIHAQAILLEGTIAEIKISYEKELAAKAEELRVKPKFIKGMTKVITSKPLNLDSLIKVHASVRMDTVEGETIYTIKTDTVPVMVYDSISITQYSKNIGWFGLKRRAMLDVTANSGIGTVKVIEGFQVKTSGSNLNIGPIVGITYDGIKFRPIVGFGLQYKLIGFRVGKH